MSGTPDELDWDTALERAYRVAYGVLRDAERARDVAQEACLKALARIDSFRGDGSFPGWVRRIALNLAIDELRRLAAWDDPDALPGADDPHHAAALGEAARKLVECLARLTPRQQDMFLSKYLDQSKTREVAAEMHTAEGTVSATLHAAATNLRNCLTRGGIDRGWLH